MGKYLFFQSVTGVCPLSRFRCVHISTPQYSGRINFCDRGLSLVTAMIREGVFTLSTCDRFAAECVRVRKFLSRQSLERSALLY